MLVIHGLKILSLSPTTGVQWNPHFKDRKVVGELGRDPEWKAAYTAQVHEMVEQRAAMELTEEIR